MKKLAAIVAGAALVAFAAACSTETNTNAVNENRASNTNAVTNTNVNTNAAAPANANASTGNYNANISKAEYEKDKERYAREAKAKGETIGQGLEDGWLWVKTKGALALVSDLHDSTINVDVNNDVVTLRGSVTNAAQKKKAEAC